MTPRVTRTPNSDQLSAIRHTDGPLRIIAGPGSGKTFTLVERLVHLVTEHGLPPEQILISTFTEKAATELITRASDRLAPLDVRVNFNEMYIGTLHSICLRIVDQFRHHTRLHKNYALWDEFDQQYTLFQNLNRFLDINHLEQVVGRTDSSQWSLAERIGTWINKASEELLDPDRLRTSTNTAAIALGELLARYRELLAEHNALDFSSIQVEAWRLLIDNPDVLAELRERVHYLMIDEYQDTNTVQEEIILLLAGERANVCVVGDDDQSLYRFRGATVRNILEFPERFPSGACRTITLDTNYRSHPDIVRFYNRWIAEDLWGEGAETQPRFRVAKTIRPDSREFVDGPAVLKVSAPAEEWHQAVLSMLTELRGTGNVTDWNQVAFLFSSVRSTRVTALAEFLDAQDIPVYAPRSGMFFEREEVILMIGGLMALFPQANALIRARWKGTTDPPIWNYYENALTLFIDRLTAGADPELMEFLRTHAQAHYPLTRNTNYAFADLFYRLLGFPLFARYVGDGALGDVRESRPARNLARLSHLLNKFEYLHNVTVIRPDFIDTDLVRLFGTFFRYLYDGGIDEFEDSTDVTPSGCLSFMTIHQAKGLEFPVVVVDSLYDRPRKSHSELDMYLQENYYRKPPFEPFDRIASFDFRRKYYTAFSRPRNLLILTGPDVRNGSWPSPSKAIAPFYDPLPSWSVISGRLAAIPIDRVQDTHMKEVYAFTSHISLYENCPRQYKFFRELDFIPVRSGNILFGSLVHQTIEDIHRAALAGDQKLITEAQIDSWFRDNYRNLSARHRQYLSVPAINAALRHVMTYVNSRRRVWDDIREAEVDVSLVKEEYILTGTVDLIRGKEGTVEIVDFKSDEKPDVNDPEDRERLERYRRQLEVYGHIVAERNGHRVSALHLFYTGENIGNPYISWKHDENRIEETMAGIETVIADIESKRFAVAERPLKLCRECDVRSYCDRNSENN